MNKFEEIKDELKKFYLKPNSLKEATRHFNLPISTCRYYLKKLGIKLHSKEITDKLQTEMIEKNKEKNYLKWLNQHKDKVDLAITYYQDNHSLLETAQEYNLNRRSLAKAFKYLGITRHSKEETNRLKVEKTRKNNFEKYGVENYTETEEFKQKSKDTCLKKYGETSYTKTKEYLSKEYNTKSKNKSFHTSSDEEYFYGELLKIFNKNDVIRQYRDKERYPFACDFYIKSIDTFIELNLTWTHGYHKFDINNESDKNKLAIWKEKAKTSSYYRNAIKVWTIKDPLKQKIAKDNNLNYFVAYIPEDISKILSQLKQN